MKIKLTVENIKCLLEGKKLHCMVFGQEELVILPPQGNIVMTREEFNQIKHNIRVDVALEFVELLDKIQNRGKHEISNNENFDS